MDRAFFQPSADKVTDLQLAKYHRPYSIPDSIRMRVPDKNESILSSRPKEFAFYLDFLVAGFRFPFLEERKRKVSSSNQGPDTTTPEIWKDKGPNIIIPEAQKGKVRTPSPLDSDPPYFVGLAQGTTHIRLDPAVSTFHVPQGEGVSDRLGVWLSDPIARLREFVLAELLPNPPHLESIIPTAAHSLTQEESQAAPIHPKHALRSRGNLKITQAKYAEESMDLLERIEQLEQELQIQTACREHEVSEAKKFKEECQILDGQLMRSTMKISEAKAKTNQAIPAHRQLIVDFQAFQEWDKKDKKDLITQVTTKKEAIITQTQRTIDSLQAVITRLNNTNSLLQELISNLEGSVTGLKEEECNLQKSLDLKEESIAFLEGRRTTLIWFG
ncbi:hypothetical protein CJ030_MR1G022983 [Morella rubra]|uniref:Uncharacterized protein n=1 Tax=Morella rubra TaxID=262757 RepID=A0A6A1WTC3_9ROSI|nr:hypothetical protein CJ030_MR1G022983 [Morella rubra]